MVAKSGIPISVFVNSAELWKALYALRIGDIGAQISDEHFRNGSERKCVLDARNDIKREGRRFSGKSLFQLAYFLQIGKQNEEFKWLPKLSTNEIEDLTYDLYKHFTAMDNYAEATLTPTPTARSSGLDEEDIQPSFSTSSLQDILNRKTSSTLQKTPKRST
ncbi:hypothetical protein DMENIID0001_045100 [Sergentomyia squamirostris]